MHSKSDVIFKKTRLAILLAYPLLLFTVLRFMPAWDIHAWSLSWYTRLIQYYFGAFASFMALVAALFASNILGVKTHARAIFFTFGFITISAFLLLSSIATPNIIIPDNNDLAFLWSLRLSFPLGGLCFAIASMHWPETTETYIVTYRRFIWLGGFIIFAAFVYFAFFNTWPLEILDSFDPYIQYILATIATGSLLWAAWRTRFMSLHRRSDIIRGRLAIAFCLLAEAQFFITFAPAGRLSWLLYVPSTLSALIVALSGILSTLESSRDLQVTRYFTGLGSILIVGLSLASVELGMRWLANVPGVNRTSLVPLMAAQGALSFIVLYVVVVRLNRLITDRTVALRREQRLRSELTQLIVHDLKSPLTVIMGGIGLLGKENLGEMMPKQRRLLANLEHSGQDILNMINDLLDVERLEAGVLQLQRTITDLNHLLDDRIADSHIIARTHKQKLTLDIPKPLPDVRVDKALLRRVIDNLLGNALKFAPDEGKIQLHAAADQEQITISVADSGPGIPVAERHRIFEKFAQVKGGERRGAGLGLTFCKMVVEAHGGTISVEESTLGGALFIFSLPLVTETSVEKLTAASEYTEWRLETT